MTREFIINELNNRGINAEPKDIIKNGIVMEGIIIGEGNVRPTIYKNLYEHRSESEIETVVEEIVGYLKDVPEFEPDLFMNWDYIKTRLQLCIQKKGDEAICKRDFLDLEQYIRVIVDENSSYKVKPEMLEKFGITEDELFQVAKECTKKNVVIEDMANIMAEMMGISVKEFIETESDAPQMIIVTNESRLNGASSIYFIDILKEIADRYESDLVIIPSSIHECILYPAENIIDFRNFDEMIQEVNATQVAPEEVLSNHAYRFNRDDCRISYYNRGEKSNYHTLADM